MERQTGLFWGLPKGHVNPGESFAQAALRETCEETGLCAPQLHLAAYLGRIRYEFTTREPCRMLNVKDVYFFLVLVPGGRPPQSAPGCEEGIREIRWLPLREAQQLVSYEDYRRMLAAAERALHQTVPPPLAPPLSLDSAANRYTMGA